MEISKDERELYDRQIRLWGLEGQNRLRKSRILVLGTGAVAVELVKNLCLAGVGALTLQSTTAVVADDLAYNFFLDEQNLGKNAAEASVPRVQRLNPRVEVRAEVRGLPELDAAELTKYDVIVATQTIDKAALESLNETVRDQCAFYYAQLHGWGGFLFVDLGTNPYQFVVEKELPKENAQPGRVNATQTIVSAQEPAKGADSATTKLTITETYAPLRAALQAAQNFGQALKVRQRNKISPWLPAFLALLDDPTNPDIVAKTTQLGLPTHIIPSDFAEQFARSRGIELSGMASVLGGTLSQEIINFLTMREYPIQNVHIYDGLDGKGPQYYLH